MRLFKLNIKRINPYLFYIIIKLLKEFIQGVNFVLLLLRLSLVKPSIIYLGDSHAYHLSGNAKTMKTFSINKSILTIWIGPKLLYTIANYGFSLNQ